jgi:hypothetical protein
VGSKDAELKHAIDGHEQERHAQHRRGQHLDDAGRVDRPDEQRQLVPARFLARRVCTGHDEVQPGHDRGQAEHEHTEANGATERRRVVL